MILEDKFKDWLNEREGKIWDCLEDDGYIRDFIPYSELTPRDESVFRLGQAALLDEIKEILEFKAGAKP